MLTVQLLEKYVDKESIDTLKKNANKPDATLWEVWEMMPPSLQNYVMMMSMVEDISQMRMEFVEQMKTVLFGNKPVVQNQSYTGNSAAKDESVSDKPDGSVPQ